MKIQKTVLDDGNKIRLEMGRYRMMIDAGSVRTYHKPDDDGEFELVGHNRFDKSEGLKPGTRYAELFLQRRADAEAEHARNVEAAKSLTADDILADPRKAISAVRRAGTGPNPVEPEEKQIPGFDDLMQNPGYAISVARDGAEWEKQK